MVNPVIGEVVVLPQPVVPFGLTTVRSNPPWNQPQVSPAVLSRSPIFSPDNSALNEPVFEQTSPRGSASPISVKPPCPSAIWSLEGLLVDAIIPLVWPDIRLIAPGVD